MIFWQHLRTIAWLRWRLTINQLRKGGSLNAALGLLLMVLSLLAAGVAFLVGLLVGAFAMSRTSPHELLLVWDVIIGMFLAFWIVGLVTDLQRSESLSPEKLLHLPISLSGTFLLNYLGSWFSLSLILFLPAATGLGLGLLISQGPALLILFPLLIGFVLMVTALTHQLRGWLQILMANKRRRRTIITIVTTSFILLAQVPNLINVVFQRSRPDGASNAQQRAFDQLQAELTSHTIDPQQYEQRVAALRAEFDRQDEELKQDHRKQELATVELVNMIVPPGWFPYGVRAAAEGNVLPGLLGTIGLLAIAGLSLRRSYRSTILYYTRGLQPRRRKRSKPAREATAGPHLLERQIPLLSDGTTAVMLGSIQSLMRSPEGKILVISPLLMLGFFGMMIFWGRDRQIPDMVRPFVGMGVISMTMLCYVQVLFNLFGFDRAGFRATVLSPCPRRDVLLGKNLAVAPLALGVSALALVGLQLFRPLPFTMLLATLVQLPATYLLFCLLGNAISIVAPTATASGSLKPAQAKWLTIVIHTLAALLSPVAMLPATLAVVAELLVHETGWLVHVPIYLLGSLLQLAVIVWIYLRLLPFQGRWLQHREQKILEVVTTRID